MSFSFPDMYFEFIIRNLHGHIPIGGEYLELYIRGGVANAGLSRRAHAATAFTASGHHRITGSIGFVDDLGDLFQQHLFSSTFSVTMTSLLAFWVMWVTCIAAIATCVLDSSHAWTFLLGCGFGLLLAVGWFNLASYSPSTTYEPSTAPPEMSID